MSYLCLVSFVLPRIRKPLFTATTRLSRSDSIRFFLRREFSVRAIFSLTFFTKLPLDLCQFCVQTHRSMQSRLCERGEAHKLKSVFAQTSTNGLPLLFVHVARANPIDLGFISKAAHLYFVKNFFAFSSSQKMKLCLRDASTLGPSNGKEM